MVVTFLPGDFADSGVWQERTALPSTCTVQAPHRPEPQPNLVPVSFRCSHHPEQRRVGVDIDARALPLTVNATAMCSSIGSCWRTPAARAARTRRIWKVGSKAGRQPAIPPKESNF